MKAVLAAYFQPAEDETTLSVHLSWWCDELQDWTHEQAVWALRKWNRDHPRTRPTPGDIVAILKAERGRQKAAEVARIVGRDEDRPIQRVTAEEASRILASAGLRPKTFGGHNA